MIWLLRHHGRVIARGSRSAVLDAGEERGLIRIDTLGHATAAPVHVPRLVDRAAEVTVVGGRA